MRVSDIVSFSKESFFNGAVQTEWFYDSEKASVIAESYVFHGPKYYGVSNADVKAGEHRLLDTASFAKNLTDKLYKEKVNNSFVMTIAGYGTGKSHLAVCLGALFSGNSPVSQRIINNISSADAEIGAYVKQYNTKQNLVIVLNGMNNFNLDAEVLRCARLSLSKAGLQDDLLRKLTKSYDIAKHFVENMFTYCADRFNATAENVGLALQGTALKNYLLNHVETDSKALSVINTVYESVNGDTIAWDRGLSAGDILLTLQDELCGEGKPFNKILLLFDEFGRYIEYTAANPAIAGEAALQQIFEAVQTADGKIIFVSFIQNELKEYLSRIEKTANITRYIDRYRTASENLHLSSNFETILANILKKQEPSFGHTVGTAVGKYENFHNRIRSALSRWDRSANKKAVWISPDLYSTVILKGCYPLHPITVWLLSSSHQWMQQRSTLAFAAEMYDRVATSEIEGTWLPYIYPVQVIDSGIFNEMLNSEEKGLVSSQYCMLYRDIMVKVGDKLTDLEKTVLKAVLVVNMGRMAFHDKDDAISALHYCSNLKDDEVKHALKSLEDLHGVVAFDEHSKTYDLIAEANGFNEFRRIFTRYRFGVKAAITDLDETTLEQLGMNDVVVTSFGQDSHISSTEWSFARWITAASDITEGYLNSAIRSTIDNCDGEKPRGILIYAYCHANAESEVKRISGLYRQLSLNNYPVIILFLDDADGEILSALTIKKALQKFSSSDRERFKKHIADQQRVQNNKIIRKFTQCVSARSKVSSTGLVTYASRINALCTQCFAQLFTRAVPFTFDGFENKVKTQAKSSLTTICVSLLNHTLVNEQVYSSLTPKDKNRVSSALSTKGTYSWRLFNDKCQLVEPQNKIIKEILDEVTQELSTGEKKTVYLLFNKYTAAPYGMNENSIALLVSYFIAYFGNRYLYYIGAERLTSKHWTDNKGKLKIPEIKKIAIQYNVNASIDIIGDFCKKALSNTVVENCVNLKKELERLVSQEGETDQNKYLIAQTIAYIDEGIRLEKVIYEKLDKARTIIDEGSKKFSIVKTVKVLDMIPEITPTIEEGIAYEYSNKYKQAVLKLQSDLHVLFDRFFVSKLKTIKCDITELSQFKLNYNRVAKILHEHDCEALAVATEARIAEVETELKAKQHYEASLVECEKDLALSTTTEKYQDCCDLSKKLHGWCSFFAAAKDLPESVVAPLKKRLNDAINYLEKRKSTILSDYQSTIDNLSNARSTSDLRQVDDKLSRFYQMQLDESISLHIVVIRDAIQAAINEISHLPKDIDGLAQFIKQFNKTANEHCWKTILACATATKEGLESEQAKWMQKYVIVAEASYKTMSQHECAAWLDRTRTYPDYFTEEAIKRFNEVKELVESRLHRSRVEAIISMYDALTENEKAEFKRLMDRK